MIDAGERMNEDEQTYIDDSSLPEAVRVKIAAMVALGYDRRHLVVTEDGTVLFDQEACDLDVHNKIFGKEK